MEYHSNAKLQNIIRKFQAIALLFAVLLVGSNAFVLGPILSDVARGLSTQPARIAWAISAFGGTTAITAFVLAGLIDRLPVGRVLGSAALLLALAQVSSGASRNWLWLCLSQALAGAAVGILLPSTYATAVATAPKGREAARLGLVLTGWAISLVLAVPLAAFVTELLGWRAVYDLLAVLSTLVGAGLWLALSEVQSPAPAKTPPWRALRLPGVAPVLIVMFAYMTAFYGSFAFFGEGIRRAFNYTAEDTGLFVLAYGVGFGLAGFVLSLVAPRITQRYVLLTLLGITISYAGWRFAFASPQSAFIAAVIWGALNQLGLNTLVVSLDRRAADARGAVMGLNGAVTYSAVFSGPLIMGPVFERAGFVAVSGLAAVLLFIGAIVSWKAM